MRLCKTAHHGERPQAQTEAAKAHGPQRKTNGEAREKRKECGRGGANILRRRSRTRAVSSSSPPPLASAREGKRKRKTPVGIGILPSLLQFPRSTLPQLHSLPRGLASIPARGGSNRRGRWREGAPAAGGEGGEWALPNLRRGSNRLSPVRHCCQMSYFFFLTASSVVATGKR